MPHLKKYRSPNKDTYNVAIPKELFVTGFKTTYQDDFKRYANAVKTTYKYEQKRFEDPPKVVSKPYEPEDHEIFAKTKKGVVVPIELHVTPKAIIRTNPHKPFEVLEEPQKVSKEEAMRTRPRLYMVPAIPLDDVKEPERQILCNHMYTTTDRQAEKESTAWFKPIKPRIDKIETEDRVSLKHDFMPPLTEKFRKAGRDWDDDQLRGDPDVTREYWIYKDPPVICGACVNPFKDIVPNEMKQVIKGLIKEEKLSLAHDVKPSCSYTGYKPKIPMGIPLEKKKMPTLHPLLSVSQSIVNRTPEEVAELVKIYNTDLHNSKHSNVSNCDYDP